MRNGGLKKDKNFIFFEKFHLMSVCIFYILLSLFRVVFSVEEINEIKMSIYFLLSPDALL
jgi:hypothetical protein